MRISKQIIVLAFCVLVPLNAGLTRGQQPNAENLSADPYSSSNKDDLQKVEGAVYLERFRDDLIKLRRETGKLSAEQQENLYRLEEDIATVNRASRNALDDLGKIEATINAGVSRFHKQLEDLQFELRRLRRETASGAVAIYTIIDREDEYDPEIRSQVNKKSKLGWIIMVTETFYKVYPINIAFIEEIFPQFRSALRNTQYNPQPLAELVYKAMFRQTSRKLRRTLEEDLRDYLKPYADKTVMWSPGGVLHYFPVTALHDGENYLVEKYNNFMFTDASFLTLAEKNNRNGKILGLGVSKKVEGFSPLPGVEQELGEIVRTPNSPDGILDGTIKLNQDFTKKELLDALGKHEYSVIHIASHFSYNQYKSSESFLLLGDGRLTIDEIKQKHNELRISADLIVLSACNTATDSAFPYLLQKYGAKAVLASLWQVSDAGTPELMIRFYKLRAEHPEMQKGESLRRAQLEMLRGKTGANKQQQNKRSELNGVTTGNAANPSLFAYDEKKPFAHPYYWSPFVLIGNWR